MRKVNPLAALLAVAFAGTASATPPGPEQALPIPQPIDVTNKEKDRWCRAVVKERDEAGNPKTIQISRGKFVDGEKSDPKFVFTFSVREGGQDEAQLRDFLELACGTKKPKKQTNEEIDANSPAAIF